MIAYMYKSLDVDIYMKILQGFKMSEAFKLKDQNLCSIKPTTVLIRSWNNLDSWYNRLSEYLIKEGYKYDHLCLCVFIRKFECRFTIIIVYVDDMNLIGTPEELLKIAKYFLKKRIWNERFGENKILSQSAIEHKTNGALIH